MKKLLQINPVLRVSTSTGRIMQEIGELAIANGWKSYIAYSYARDGIKPCKSELVPVGGKIGVLGHWLATRLFDRHGLASERDTKDFIRVIDEIDPDIIHIHNIHGYFLNYKILFDYLARRNKPVVWTVHDCWLYTGHCYYYTFAGCSKWKIHCSRCPQKKKFPASYLFDRSSKNFEDKRKAFTSIQASNMFVVPVSEWIMGEMRDSFLKNANFALIHNGIDTNVFNIYDGEDIKKKYGIEGKRLILGVASIWSREKGLFDFLELSRIIGSDEVIVLVGVDDRTKSKLPGNIIGIRRTENIQALAELYSAAEVFVNPTWQDNYPTVNMEAIACGTPVVAYDVGGATEVITEETGRAVSAGDIEGLYKAIKEIEAKGKAFYAPRCRDFAEVNFRKEDRYADYIRLYDDILSRSVQ